jgi:hypothetical protein
MTTTLRFTTHQFRSLPAPEAGALRSESRIGLFFTKASSVPPELWDWRDVNPREINRDSKVYKAMAQTLRDEPGRVHERHPGLTLVGHAIAYDEKKKELLLTLTEKAAHGVVDGAHTLDAIIQTQIAPPDNGWPANVFVKVITGVDPDQIAEIAGGLNTSQQVDLKSLENLRDHFEDLKKVLAKEPYAGQIAYKMNEDLPVDVREILYYLAVFDCSEWDDTKHPVSLFARKEGIVRRFADQAVDEKAGDSFRNLITRAPEILRLRDTIEKEALARVSGRFKASKGARIRSERNRENRLNFLNEKVNGKISLGWIMPMLGAFRANVVWNKPKGSFGWKAPLEEIVPACMDKLVAGIREVHEQENSRPEYVGRNGLSWRMSYNVVSQAILERELAQARATRPKGRG